MNSKYIIKKYREQDFNFLHRSLSSELKKRPINSQYLILIAAILERLNKNEKALEYLSRYDELGGRQESQQVDTFLTLFFRARIMQNAGKETDSIPLWRKILATDENVIDASLENLVILSAKTIRNDTRIYLAHCLFAEYQDEEALQLTNEHITNRQRGVFSHFTLKDVKEFKRMLEWELTKPQKEATNIGNSYTDKQKNRIWKHYEMLELKDSRKAAEYLEKKGRKMSDEYYMLTVASQFYFDKKEPLACLRCAEEAYRRIGNDDILVVFDYASALTINGRHAEAMELLNYIMCQDIRYIAYSRHGEGMREAKRIKRQSKEMIESILKSL